MMDDGPAATDSDETVETADGSQGAASGNQAEDATDSIGSGDAPRFELQGELPLTDGEVNELLAFIEDETGRDFLRPPVIVAQSADAFREGLQEDLGEFEEEADNTVRYLQALGLTDDGVAEVTDAFRELLLSPEGILGYYDPATDELYVPVEATADDDFRSLLVHELVHALDGQHADLTLLERLIDEGELTGDYEPVVGLQAVAEGRATMVQNTWEAANGVETVPPDDLGAAEEVPPALVLDLSVPYAFGEQYILLQGGPDQTWELLTDPPTSSEVFMIPGPTDQEPVIPVATPGAGGLVLDDFVFGAADLLVWMLGETLEPAPDLVFSTINAVDGWAGGRAVVWGDDIESCVRIALAADSERDLGEIRTLVESWADREPDGRTVETQGELVVVTGCAPYVP